METNGHAPSEAPWWLYLLPLSGLAACLLLGLFKWGDGEGRWEE
jgi:hypothetical protein